MKKPFCDLCEQQMDYYSSAYTIKFGKKGWHKKIYYPNQRYLVIEPIAKIMAEQIEVKEVPDICRKCLVVLLRRHADMIERK